MTMQRSSSRGGALLTALIILIVIIAGIWLLNAHSHRTVGDRIGDAVDALPQGVSKAAGELTDKSNLEKAGDALKDTGEAASSAVSQTSEDIKAAVDRQKAQEESASSSASSGSKAS